MRNPRTLVAAGIIFVVLLVSFSYAAFSYSWNGITRSFYNGCTKVWAHRGYNNKGPDNSLQSVRQAFRLGASGVELDVFFDLPSNQFIVSHDTPSQLHQRSLLKLGAVFEEQGHNGYFWLDFKNLKDLRTNEVTIAVTILLDLAIQYGVKDRVIFESSSGMNLIPLSRAGLWTSFWISPREGDYPIRFQLRLMMYKLIFWYGNLSAFSMDYRDFGEKTERALAPAPVNLFTVNHSDELSRLIGKQQVQVILSDTPSYRQGDCQAR
jgi:hypothetical protein